ncbi:MAG TPA: carboxypeptidase-like regulatory domain-containing protein [Polyangiales bacterium]
MRIWGLILSIVVSGAAALVAPIAQAQVGPRALPTLLSTPQLAPPDALTFALAAAAGYGVREPLTSADAVHHTGLGSLGLALSSSIGLGGELRLDGRLEKHTARGDRGSGMVGELRGYLRYAHSVGGRARLGAELGVWVPGGPAPSLQFAATTLDVLLLLDVTLAKRWSLLAGAGFRFDQSAKAFAQPEQLSTGDYVTLGLSDFHAALARVGLAREFERGQLFAEWTWDALVGSGAPSLATSPMQVAIGGRAALTRDGRLALTVSARGLVSSRPEVDPAGPLQPFPPRGELWCGLRFQTSKRAPEPADVPPAAVTPAAPVAVSTPLPEPARDGALRLRVLDAGGAPLADADVRLDQSGNVSRSDAAGSVSFAAVPFGRHLVSVEADGFQPREQTLEHAPETALHDVALEALPASGQLRLLVRDHRSGEALAAEITVDAVDAAAPTARVQRELQAGKLTLDLAPGRYQVTIRLKGYRKQKKSLEIEDRSVTILDVALHARSKR